MSRARPVGCGRRRLAILARGGSRRFWVAGDWNADALRDTRARLCRRATLADDGAVLVIDETGFLKQGKASCGVARQYTGSAGKITNCQIGVFAAYVSRHGHAFIDRALYLPKEWTDDPDRLEAAYVPADVGFATKPKLATRMIARAIAASVPFKWVAGDTVYGVGDIEQQLRRAGKGYVLGVSPALMYSDPGASDRRSPGRLQTLPDAAPIRLEAPVGGSRNQRTAAARLVLSRIGRSRCRRI